MSKTTQVVPGWQFAVQPFRAPHALLLLSLALMLFPSALSVVGWLGALGWFGWRWRERGFPVSHTAINVPLTVLLFCFAFALLLKPIHPSALASVSHLLAGVTLFFAIQEYGTSLGALWKITGALVLLALLFALGIPFGVTWSEGKVFDIVAFYSHYAPLLPNPSNPNNAAGALTPAIPLALALIASGKRWARILGAVALAPLLLLIALLQSRGAGFALALGLAVYVTLYRRWFLPLIPLLILGGLWLNSTLPNPVSLQAPYEISSSSPLTFESRRHIWSQAIQQLEVSPWVGVGVGGFSFVREENPGSNAQAVVYNHAHNLVLQVALDTGLLGAATFVVCLGYAIAAAWRSTRASDSRRALAIGILSAFVIILSHGLFDTIYWATKPAIFLWGMAGLALALARVSHDLNNS